jgi:hypothetical protein
LLTAKYNEGNAAGRRTALHDYTWLQPGITVLATTVIQSEISMALPVIAAASTTPRLYPTKIPSFLPRSAGTISDWTSER